MKQAEIVLFFPHVGESERGFEEEQKSGESYQKLFGLGCQTVDLFLQFLWPSVPRLGSGEWALEARLSLRVARLAGL